LSGDSCFAGEEYGHSRASVIYYREDGVVPVAGWELGDQVHCHNLEWECICWRGDVVEGHFCLSREVFALLAFGTSSYVLCDPLIHVWPPEVLADGRGGGVSSRMSSDLQVVESVEDFLFQGVVGWDGDPPLYVPVFQVSAVVRVVLSRSMAFNPLCDLGRVLLLCFSYLLLQLPPFVLGVFGSG
jgi:hypothetical protein